MSDNKEKMQRARDFIAANLAECCREELEWQNTALLRNGKLRAAARIYEEVDAAHATPLAQAEIARQAMRRAAQPVVLSDEELLGAVARGWCHVGNTHKVMDEELAQAIAIELRAILAAKEQA